MNIFDTYYNMKVFVMKLDIQPHFQNYLGIYRRYAFISYIFKFTVFFFFPICNSKMLFSQSCISCNKNKICSTSTWAEKLFGLSKSSQCFDLTRYIYLFSIWTNSIYTFNANKISFVKCNSSFCHIITT